MKKNEAKNLIGCCGLYCGLCNKYQSKAPSRCIGCGLGEQRSWCSIWNCCVKKHGFKSCVECDELFQCVIYLRRKVIEWIPAADNLHQINKSGLETWLAEQIERQTLLEELLQNYNEGRSMSFYCKVCARMTIDLINKSIKKAKENFKIEKIDQSDIKSRAKILKTMIRDSAMIASIGLD